MGTSIRVDELNKVLLGTGALIWQRLSGALLEVLDSRVGGDALFGGDGLAVLGFGIDLGDEDAGLECEVVGEGFPDGSEALAVYISPLVSSHLPQQSHC